MNDRASRVTFAAFPGGAQQDGDLIRIGAMFAAIARGWWVMGLATAICLAAAYHYAYTVAKPMYRATASIVMETGERAFISFDEMTGQLSRDTTSLNTEIGVLRGNDLMGRIVDALALDQDAEFNPFLTAAPAAGPRDGQTAREVAVRALLDAVEVRNLPESLIFQISVTTTDPRKSMEIANTIAETYIAEQVERKIAETQRAADWLRNRVSELQAELLQAETEVGEFRFGLDGASTDEIVRREQLASEAEAIRTLYRYLLSRLQETIAQEGLQRPDSRILSTAMLPLQPSEPRPTRILAVGGAVGLFLGLVGVFLREATRGSIRSVRTLAHQTGLPVLGALPRVPYGLRRSEMTGLIGARAVHYTEAVENLLTTLLISRVGKDPHVFVIVSPHSGDGKTSVALSMARQVSARGLRTLLIDADTRRRTVSVHADVVATGLIAVLSGAARLEEAAENNAVLGCDILGNPGRVTEPGRTLEVGGIFRLLEAARTNYDVVIIDTPPLNAVADALPYAVDADSVLLVSRWNRTTRDDLAASLGMLRQIDTTPVGVVMTQVKPSVLSQAAYQSYFQRA
jgi:capsular exopolysaccharide synthesis family protein